jgi:hypothetical protein
VENGDAYEEAVGPKCQAWKEYWADPSDERRDELAQAVTYDSLREEVLGEVAPEVADSVRRFPQYQAYPREHRPQVVARIRPFLSRVRGVTGPW